MGPQISRLWQPPGCAFRSWRGQQRGFKLHTLLPPGLSTERAYRNAWLPVLSWKESICLLLKLLLPTPVFLGFPGGSDGKESIWNAGDLGSIPGLGRSPGGGHGNPCPGLPGEQPAWKIFLPGESPWTVCQGSQRVRHNRATKHKASAWGSAF